MSQTRIRRDPLVNNDWMRELEQDAHNVQALIGRINTLAHKALHVNSVGDKVGTAILLGQILEGVELLCDTCNVSLPA